MQVANHPYGPWYDAEAFKRDCFVHWKLIQHGSAPEKQNYGRKER